MRSIASLTVGRVNHLQALNASHISDKNRYDSIIRRYLGAASGFPRSFTVLLPLGGHSSALISKSAWLQRAASKMLTVYPHV